MNNIYLQSISESLRVNLYFNDTQDLHDQEQQELAKQQAIDALIAHFWLHPHQDTLQAILKQAFGHDSFREGQLEAIQSILHNQSVLLVQKTGHGKSLVYQMLSLLYQDGIGLVFSPLISLMIDQISKLPRCVAGIAYHSLLISQQKQHLMQLVKEKKVKLIFCTPEIF